jgi:hypothetical protein
VLDKPSANLSPTSPRPTLRAEFLEPWALRKLVSEPPEPPLRDEGDLRRRRERSLEWCDLPFSRCLVSGKTVSRTGSMSTAPFTKNWLTSIGRLLGTRTRDSKRSDFGGRPAPLPSIPPRGGEAASSLSPRRSRSRSARVLSLGFPDLQSLRRCSNSLSFLSKREASLADPEALCFLGTGLANSRTATDRATPRRVTAASVVRRASTA